MTVTNASGCVKPNHIYNENRKNTTLAAPFIVIPLIFIVLTGAVLGQNTAPLLPHATPGNIVRYTQIILHYKFP
jgi:hypothetical protein